MKSAPSKVEKDRWFVVNQLIAITKKEAVYLEVTANRIRALAPDLAWIESLETNVESGEMLDAFVSRFGRLQDTIGDKLLPAMLLANLEPVGSQLDNLLRAEKMGWIDSSERWIEIRTLRNRLVHEYVASSATLHQALIMALDAVPVLLDTQKRLTRHVARLRAAEKASK